ELSQWAVRLGVQRDGRPRSPEALMQQYQREADALASMHQLRVPMLPGTDRGIYLVYPGSSLHDELALMARDARMTPYDVLRAATFASSQWLGAAGLAVGGGPP